jgi:hypothetical protein
MDEKQPEFYVDLSSNKITIFNLSEHVDFFSRRHMKPFSLDLSNNPLTCDCWALELQELLTGGPAAVAGPLRQMVVLEPGLRCAASLPDPVLAGRLLGEVPTSDLLCHFPSETVPALCPTPCQCTLDRAARRTVVNCSHQGLTALPAFLPLIPGQSDQVGGLRKVRA